LHINHDDILLKYTNDAVEDVVDELEHEFITQEQQDDLRNELAALLTKEKQQ
jgi:hypothetical protein